MDFHVGQTYPDIIVDTGLDISAGTVFLLRVRKPSRDVVTWTGVLEGTNFIRYALEDKDLDQPGIYEIQSRVTIAGKLALGDITTITVSKSL